MTLVGVAARNILRNKFRAVLTVLGVAVAILTFMLLRTVVYAWTAAEDYAQKDRVVTRNKITFVMPLPKRYIDEIRSGRIAGVKQAAYANWFGGKDPNHDQEFFATIAIDHEQYFDVLSEASIPAEQLEAFKKDKQGAIVGDVLAAKLGYKVGQQIVMESGIYPAPPDNPWTFHIVGIYTTTAKSIDRSTFLFRWDYLNENMPDSRKDQIGWIMSRVTDPNATASVTVAIDKAFGDQDIQTLSQDERAFQASFLAGFSAVLTGMDIVCLVILVIMALILGNTIAMGVRERTNEYGVLRAIGFLPRHLVVFILGESVLTSLVGGALGLLISYPIVEKGFGGFLEENMGQFFPYVRIPMTGIILAVLASLVLGVLAAVLPAWGASRLKVTEALRRVA